jgi:uncharacterized protein (TIGR02186 family)
MRHGTFAALLLGAALLSPAGARAELTARANHDHITIDFGYHGSSVSVRGVVDPDVDLVIRIASPEGREVFKQKGKKVGVLWMNVGTLTFEQAPRLYELFSTRPVEALLLPEEAERHVLGYPALERHLAISPLAGQAEKAIWFAEYVRFKESAGLYAGSVGQITFGAQGGHRTYFIDTPWPYQAPPGDYLVTVFAVRGGRVVETATAPVVVEQVGSVRYLASMAREHGALYGLLSIVVALGAGFGVGFVFRKGGGSH